MAICPSCGAESPEGFSYCGRCGVPLTEPPPLPEERKVVTALFCDLVGFTALSEVADPEDVDRMLRLYNKLARTVIESFGGTVEKFIGDAVVAVFGVPAVHEDDPERAVRAALRLVERTPELPRFSGRPVELRVGINTGEALVRLDVAPGSGEGFLTGDAVNTAARLQSVAPPLGVAVGEATHAGTRLLFDYEALAPVSLKGKSLPVRAWLAKAARGRGSFASGRDFATRFVGRDAELGTLKRLFAETLDTSSTRSVLIVGEPGIGKSRLVAEFAADLDEQPGQVTLRQGRCPPYGEDAAFRALAEIVKAQAGVLGSDDAETAAAKLAAVVPPGADAVWMSQRLRPLLGIEATRASCEESYAAWRRFLEHLAADGPAVLVFEDLHWADGVLLAFCRQLMAEPRPVPLLVVATARPTLFERAAEWATSVANERLSLEPLPDAETTHLAARLLETSELSTELRASILDRCGGNPLYVEELVRLLRDRGLLERVADSPDLKEAARIALPDTLQAVIAARLDALRPQQKALLAHASVIGRSFWAGAVAALEERPLAAVVEELEELGATQLVRSTPASSMAAEREFVFWHALTREVVYAQLPRAARARGHAAAAAWLEGRASGRLEDVADVLVHHYTTALDLARTIGDEPLADRLVAPAGRWLARAAEHSRQFDSHSAERSARRALELLAADAPERAHVLFLLAEAIAWLRPKEAIPRHQEALACLRASGRRNETASCLVQFATTLFETGTPGWPPLVDEAAELLDEANPSPDLVYALEWLAFMHRQAHPGHHAVAIDFADRALAVAERLMLPAPAGALGWRGVARLELGDASGLDDVQRAIEVADRQGDVRRVILFRGWVHGAILEQHGPAAALSGFRETAALAEHHELEIFALVNRSWAMEMLELLGEWDVALCEAADLEPAAIESDYKEALLSTRGTRAVILTRRGQAEAAVALADWLSSTAREADCAPDVRDRGLTFAAMVQCGLGRQREARDLLAEALKLGAGSDAASVRTALACGDLALAERFADSSEPRDPLSRHWSTTVAGLLAEHCGEHARAKTAYSAAARGWHDFAMPYEEAQALLGLGRCLLALARSFEAAPVLRAARAIFARLGAKPALVETDSLLAHRLQ